jgi:hypothetical protein
MQHTESPALGTDITALDAIGSGHLAALVLDLTGQEGSAGPAESFMEGDERVYVDGSRSPSVYGTGTEDAFNGGFYYANGAFSLPTHGAGPEGDAPATRGTQSQYRIFATDGVAWRSSVHWGIEHGGGDETAGESASATAWWYADSVRPLTVTDRMDTGDVSSVVGHAMRGAVDRVGPTSAYFEGDQDGNVPVSTYVVGGEIYPAPPAEDSPEGVTASGVTFRGPVSFRMAIGRNNQGIVLRRMWNDGTFGSALAVRIDNTAAGTWFVPDVNSSKQWREDDFAVPSALTAGKRQVRVTLIPLGPFPENLYGFEALS